MNNKVFATVNEEIEKIDQNNITKLLKSQMKENINVNTYRVCITVFLNIPIHRKK